MSEVPGEPGYRAPAHEYGHGPTWNQLAKVFPEFVQWIAATHGPLPEGTVTDEDWSRFKAEYEATHG